MSPHICVKVYVTGYSITKEHDLLISYLMELLYMREHYFCEYFVRDLGYMCRVRLSLGLERIQGVSMQIIRIKLELLEVI